MTSLTLDKLIIQYQSALIYTDFIKELWMIPDRLVAERLSDTQFKMTTPCLVYRGKLFTTPDSKTFYVVDTVHTVPSDNPESKIYDVTAQPTAIAVTSGQTKPLCTPQDPMTIEPGDIANYEGSGKLTTTLGRFVANYQYFVYPFGNAIGYHNQTFNASFMEKQIANARLNNKIEMEDLKEKYINILSLFGHSTEIICPGITEKTITVPKSIQILRDKLVKDNHDALVAGDAAVMADIEGQLISAYKDYLKDDPSLNFLLKSKYFKVVLKKLLLTQGLVEVFGTPGEFKFVENPMGQGWKVEDLPTIFNEIRAGSFARAIETADGGVIAKLILRVFQDTRIDFPDCKTKHGEQFEATKEIIDDFVWNYTVEKDGSNKLITPDNKNDFVGKKLTVRTPGYCEYPKGYCSKCFGYLFEQIGQKAFAPIATDFSRHITTAALKSMHGKSLNIVDLSDINRFVL